MHVKGIQRTSKIILIQSSEDHTIKDYCFVIIRFRKKGWSNEDSKRKNQIQKRVKLTDYSSE